jgi:hypothetical protein
MKISQTPSTVSSSRSYTYKSCLHSLLKITAFSNFIDHWSEEVKEYVLSSNQLGKTASGSDSEKITITQS